MSLAPVTSSHPQKPLQYRHYFHPFRMWTWRLGKLKQLALSHTEASRKASIPNQVYNPRFFLHMTPRAGAGVMSMDSHTHIS